MNHLQGLDVSSVQGRVDWKAAKAAGLVFGIAKASEGVTITDTRFRENWRGMLDAGLVRGAYLFFHPDDPVEAQVHTFLEALEEDPLVPGDLPPAIDVETTDKMSPQAVTDQVEACVSYLAGELGVTPMLYCSPLWWDGSVKDHTLGALPLWTANYGVWKPFLPQGWTKATIWQYTGSGRWPGVGGEVDLDWFLGTQEELLTLAGGSDVIG